MCCSQADASSDDGDGGGSVDDDGGASVDRDGVSESVAVKPKPRAMTATVVDPSTESDSGIGAVELSSLAMVAAVDLSTETMAVDVLQSSRRVQR